ncbi:unnamed protein product, partial [marine sediment metagenome]
MRGTGKMERPLFRLLITNHPHGEYANSNIDKALYKPEAVGNNQGFLYVGFKDKGKSICEDPKKPELEEVNLVQNCIQRRCDFKPREKQS